MVRTVISLEEDDKAWLDRKAAADGVSMTELVRRAVREMRARSGKLSTQALLEKTRGTWTQGDGLQWQEKLRDEW